MIKEGVPLTRTYYLANAYGPPEWWPEDIEAVLPDALKVVSREDKIGVVIGSA